MIRLFRVFIPVSTFTLFIAEILFVSLSFLAVSYAMAEVDPTDYLFYDGGIMGILGVTAIFVLGLYFSGLYSGVYVKSKIIMLYQLFLVTGLTFLFEGLISSVAERLRLPIRTMLAGSALSVAVIYAWRLFFSRYASRILGKAQVVLVGTSAVVGALGRYIGSHPQSGMEIAGCVLEEESVVPCLPGVPSLGILPELPDIVETTHPSRIVVGTSGSGTVQLARVLEDLRFAGQNVQEAADTYEAVCGRVWVRDIEPKEVIYSSRFAPPARHVVLQLYAGPLIALAALILVLPVLAFTWLALRLSSHGPAIEKRVRIGLDGRPFLQYRFRIGGAKEKERGLTASIRRFHLDGLPQLFNVLKGEMALVGPRAERPEFVDVLSEMIPYYPERHCVRPGMTGWEQIQDQPLLEDTLTKLEYDLYYIKNASMSLDTLVIFQTLRAIFLEASEE
jgi:lipopolysaccharide/colanic/teichoic acid biosynthesis glycosyltransferase